MGTKEVRVSAPARKPAVRLPKLLINVYQGTEVVRTVEVDDPRELLIETFNRDNSELHLVAAPA